MSKKEDKLQKLGNRIQSVRKSKGLSQTQLAHKINKDRESISRLERGGMNPTYIYLSEICEGLEIHIKDLLAFE